MKLQYSKCTCNIYSRNHIAVWGISSKTERKRAHANYWNRADFKCGNQSVYFY